MKYYVQFLDKNMKGETVEALGSDGVFILDGRNNIYTMCNDAEERMNRLRFVKPNYIGWRIMKGTRFDNSTCIKEKIK